MAVDFGIDCTDLASSFSMLNTVVTKANPAASTCDVGAIDLRSVGAVTDAEFAAFSASVNNLTSQGNCNGAGCDGAGASCLTWNAPGDFTAFEIQAGEYIGVFAVVAGTIELGTSGGSSIWYKSGDYIPTGGAQAFTLGSNWQISLGGRCAAGGPSGPTRNEIRRRNQFQIQIIKYWPVGIAWAGIKGSIDNPRLTRREMANPFNWMKKNK